jgi:hypothetical protein
MQAIETTRRARTTVGILWLGGALLAASCANGGGGASTFLPPEDDAAPPRDAGAIVPDAPLVDAASPGSLGTTPSDEAGQCGVSATPASPFEIELSSEFAHDYKTYVLGPVPGVPNSRLGGCVLSPTDPNTLLVAIESESQNGMIVAVPLKRDFCGHVVGFAGSPTPVAQTPYVDANLVWGPKGILFYSQWPGGQISELLPNQSAPAYTVALADLGVIGSPGGVGFVPPGSSDPGGLRIVTWPQGFWYRLAYSADEQTYAITAAKRKRRLPGGVGGFAYVPEGSPGFPKQSLIVSEWGGGGGGVYPDDYPDDEPDAGDAGDDASLARDAGDEAGKDAGLDSGAGPILALGNAVAVYEVDAMGDPIVTTRKRFFTKFPKPWGAYFEPNTGDFIFLTWGRGSGPDELYVVQGFAKPPPGPR